MARAIRFHQTGGPEVLELETVDVGEPGPGQARVRHTYVAVNFIDVYFRTGRYPLTLPNGLGSDAVGVVEAIGEGVTDVRVGDRVGYLIGPQGAYSDVRILPADVLIPLPAGIDDRKTADVTVEHNCGRVHNGCLGAYGDSWRVHDFLNEHGRLRAMIWLVVADRGG